MQAKTTYFNQPIDKEKVILFFSRKGYYIHSENTTHLTMKKTGTKLTLNGENYPKELSFVFNSQDTRISLKYDGCVLFDTGDLQNELNLISKDIKSNISSLI